MGSLFKNDQGFSLVETLIATVIFALVSASGVVLLSGYQDSRLGLQAADERLAQLEAARSLMRSDLLMVVNRPVRDALGGSKLGFEGGGYLPADAVMRFVRGGDMGALLSGQSTALKRVEYILKDGSLIRRTYAQTDITLDTNHTDLPLLANVEKFDVRFEAEGVWVDEWGNGSEVAAPPKLAEVQIEFLSGRSLSMTFLVGVGA